MFSHKGTGRTDRQTWLGALVGLICGGLALGPAIKPGYLLFYDMVFVPRLDLSERTLGTDGSVPRAVPGDLVVSLLSHLAPGWVVQKVVLLVVFVGVAAGAASFFRSRTGAVAAAVAAAWNPYVGERLAIGHWGFLLGYACLPFLMRAVLSYRRTEDGARFRLLLWILLTALTGSTGAVIGLLTTVAALLVPVDEASPRERLRTAMLPLGAFVVVNSAWWFPFLFLAPRDAADPAGVTAFMSRSDTPLGVVPSVLTGGGIWNEGVWFADRRSPFVAAAATLAVAVVLVVAWRTLRSSERRTAEQVERRAALAALCLAGGVGLFIACAAALPGGEAVMTWIVTSVPGGGLLRDSQKFIAPWMVAVAVASGITAERLTGLARAAGAAGAVRVALTAALALWPVATFAGLAFGAGGRWHAVDYPAGHLRMAQRIESLSPGKVAVFPWNLYRRYSWNHDVVTLDPWQRLVGHEVLVNDDLPLSDRVVRGESTESARITAAVSAGAPGGIERDLRRAGVRYVLVQIDQPAVRSFDPVGRTPIASEPGLRLYELPGVATAPTERPPWRWTGLVGPVVGVAAVLVTGFADRRARARTRG